MKEKKNNDDDDDDQIWRHIYNNIHRQVSSQTHIHTNIIQESIKRPPFCHKHTHTYAQTKKNMKHTHTQ